MKEKGLFFRSNDQKEKDYKSQNNLKLLFELLNNNRFNKLTKDVIINI